MCLRRAIFLSVISGTILGISFNYADYLWPVSFVVLLPFLHVLYTYKGSKKLMFLLGWLFGFVFLGIALIWFWDTLPLTSLGIENGLFSFFFVFTHWGLTVFVLSLFIAIGLLLFIFLKRDNFLDVIIVPILWVIFEYARMWGFAILTYAPSSLFAPHFSNGFIGYSLASNHNLLQLSSLGGVYTLSFFVLFFNILVYYIVFLWDVKTKRRIYVGLIVGMLLVVFAYLPYEKIFSTSALNDIQELSVAVLHTNFPSVMSISLKERNDRQLLYKKLVIESSLSSNSPDIIILPEDSRFLQTLDRNNELQSFLRNYFNEQEILIVDSGLYFDDRGKYSRIKFFNTKSQDESAYDKLFLVPGGEYSPAVIQSVLSLIGQVDLIDFIDSYKTYSHGNELKSGKYNDIEIGALFCSEIYSPSLYKSLVNDLGSDLLINISSQSRFHGSKTLYRQNINVAKVHAVQNNSYFIQASNYAPSFILDNKGNVVAESERGIPSVLYGEVYH